jgi:hypothetical protein
MDKRNLKKELKHLYGTSMKDGIVSVDVPRMNYLMIDGQGDPNTSKDYQDAIEALYSVAYTLKFKIKKGDLAIDFGVMPLEGLWWMDDMTQFTVKNKSQWNWTSMIMQPEWISLDLLNEARAEIEEKKSFPQLKNIRFESLDEGGVVQILHTGPYTNEEPAIEALHAHIKSEGKHKKGKHHEIYLNDMRRTEPKNLKTIIRQPVS